MSTLRRDPITKYQDYEIKGLNPEINEHLFYDLYASGRPMSHHLDLNKYNVAAVIRSTLRSFLHQKILEVDGSILFLPEDIGGQRTVDLINETWEKVFDRVDNKDSKYLPLDELGKKQLAREVDNIMSTIREAQVLKSTLPEQGRQVGKKEKKKAA